MKILFVNQVFYPDVVSTAQHLTDIAVDLAKAGHDVTVLASRCKYRDPSTIFPRKENHEGVKVIRVWPFAPDTANQFLRVLDAMCMQISFAWKLLWLPKFDRVVGMTSPPLIAFIALLFSQMRGARFIYWMMDLNPDQAIAIGWLKKDSFYAKLLSKVLLYTLERSHEIVVLDKAMRDRVIEKGELRADPKVLAPWAHDDDLRTVDHANNPFRKKHGLDEQFVVMYSGNHSLCHPLTTILEAAKEFKEDDGVVFMFVGGGERAQDVRYYKTKHGLKNIHQIPYQDLKDLSYSLSAADLHFVVMGNEVVGIVHPCKVYGLLSIGRPFAYLGPYGSHIYEIITALDHKYHIYHGDYKKLVEIINDARAWSDKRKTEFMKRANSEAEKYSRQKLSPKFATIITGGKG